MLEKLPDINLLPKYERQSSNVFYLLIAIIIIVLLSYLVLGIYYFSTKGKLETADAKYTELSSEADELQLRINYLETEETSLKQAVLFADNYNIPTSAFIDDLTDLLPKHSYLSEYSYSSQVVDITAHFETLDTVANYTTDLITSDFIKDTKVDDVETFTLKAEEEDDPFGTIPRYAANFTLQINKNKLMEGAKEKDE